MFAPHECPVRRPGISGDVDVYDDEETPGGKRRKRGASH